MTNKILVLNQHFYPEVAATEQLILDLCEVLVRTESRVKVVTGNPNVNLNEK